MAPHVLVVDDYEDTLLLYVEELRASGYVVTGTPHPNKALRLAVEEKPDVVVLDIAMPDLDGYELARLLRSYATTRGIRLIAVSAHPFDMSPQAVPPGGWDAYAQKPFEPGALSALVAQVLAAPPTSIRRTGPVPIPSSPPEGKEQGGEE